MIIRCPECSTGFKLPESRVTSKGIKLRCSRCSHVFRVRSTADGENEIYYQAEDREDGLGDGSAGQSKHGDELSEPLEEMMEDSSDGKSESDSVDEDAGNRTVFGMPTAVPTDFSVREAGGLTDSVGSASTDSAHEKVEEPAKLASFAAAFAEKKAKNSDSGGISGGITGGIPKPSFNPFPHTGLDLKPRKRNAFESIGEELAADIEEATAAAMTPGADIPSDLQALIEQTSQVDAPVLSVSAGLEHADDVVSDGLFADYDAPAVVEVARPAVVEVARPVAVEVARPVAVSASASASASASVSGSGSVAVAEPVVKAEPFAVQENALLGAPDDFIDGSFEHDGPYFEPDRERIDVGGAAVAATAGVIVAAKAPTKPAVPGNRGSGAASGAAPQPARVLEPVAESWDVDDVSTDNLGGSTGVKLLLSTVFVLLIGAGFVGFIAAQNDGMVDFTQFGSMVKASFGQGEYTPRAGREEVAPVAVVVENPIEVHSVFAQLANYGVVAAAAGKGARAGTGKPEAAGQVLILRGQVRNRDAQTFAGVKLRGLVVDQAGRVLLETTGFLGGEVSQGDLEAVQSQQEAVGLLPKSASPLRENMAAPFTLIFDQIPQAVLDNNTVMYRVEVASKD